MGERELMKTVITAGADYRGTGKIYHAIAVADGQLAANPEEATGILLSKPNDGEYCAVGYAGESRYAAGAAISKGNKLTVAASGWFIAATSEDLSVGEAQGAVTSGSIGTGIFNFSNVAYPPHFGQFADVVAAASVEGTAYSLQDHKTADNGREMAGVNIGGDVATSGTGAFVGIGIADILVGDTTSAGEFLTATTSGYFILPSSGDFIGARVLTNVASGIAAPALIAPMGIMLPTSWGNV